MLAQYDVVKLYCLVMINLSEAPLDISFYEAQLGALQTDPNTRIVGSIGRMVASQQIVSTPFTEFDDRAVVGLDTTRVSDIDVLGTDPGLIAKARAMGQASIDDLAFRDSDVSLERKDGLWILKSSDADFEEPINPDVMEAVSAEVEGVKVVTVPLQTHIALHGLRERNHKKDRLTENTLRYLQHTDYRRSGGVHTIDVRKYTPFTELGIRLRVLQRQRAPTDRHSSESRHSN
jgi:hypothetical protein